MSEWVAVICSLNVNLSVYCRILFAYIIWIQKCVIREREREKKQSIGLHQSIRRIMGNRVKYFREMENFFYCSSRKVNFTKKKIVSWELSYQCSLEHHSIETTIRAGIKTKMTFLTSGYNNQNSSSLLS